METTIVHWGYIGIMEKKMETTMVYIAHRNSKSWSCKRSQSCAPTSSVFAFHEAGAHETGFFSSPRHVGETPVISHWVRYIPHLDSALGAPSG